MLSMIDRRRIEVLMASGRQEVLDLQLWMRIRLLLEAWPMILDLLLWHLLRLLLEVLPTTQNQQTSPLPQRKYQEA